MTFSKKSSLLLIVAGLILVLAILKLSGASSSSETKNSPGSEIISADSQPKNPTTATNAIKVLDTAVEKIDPATEAATQAQLKTLNEVLANHNDNDPRIDKELRTLSEYAKQKFREKYNQLPAEKRNDRGTVVFLLGRNITTEKDVKFLNDVMNEPRCLSLTDCSKAETGGDNREQDEHQGGFAVTLVYPQMVTLHSLEKFLKENPSSPLTDKAKDIIAAAKQSAVPEISKMAEGIH